MYGVVRVPPLPTLKVSVAEGHLSQCNALFAWIWTMILFCIFFLEKMIMKRWPATDFRMRTHTWTPLTVYIVMCIQVVSPNGMSRVITHTTSQKWFSSNDLDNSISITSKPKSKNNNHRRRQSSSDNQNRSMCSMTPSIWTIAFSKIISSTSCGKSNHKNNKIAIETFYMNGNDTIKMECIETWNNWNLLSTTLFACICAFSVDFRISCYLWYVFFWFQ